MHVGTRAKRRITALIAVVFSLTVVGAVTATPVAASSTTLEGKIALTKYVNGTAAELFVINPDGTGLRQVTSSGYRSDDPAWSPDGKRVALLQYTPNTGVVRLAVVTVADKSVHVVPTPSAQIRGPVSWTSNGDALVAVSETGAIVRYDIATGARTTIVPASISVTNSSPSMSEDGQKLMWLQSGGTPSLLKIMVGNADGSNPRAVKTLSMSSGSYNEPVWYPSGDKLEFEYSVYPDPATTHEAIDVATGEIVRTAYTNTSTGTFSYGWKPGPTGEHLLMNAHTPTTRQLVIADLDGNILTAVTDAAQSFDWAPVGDTPIDTVLPTVTMWSPSGESVLQNSVLRAYYYCSDDVELESCVGPVPYGAAVDTSTLGAKTFPVTATDTSGNTHTETATYTVVAPPDTIKPTVTITAPTGADIVRDAVVLADYLCADNVAGVSCVGTVPNGAAIDTATLGIKPFKVTAQDTAGNTTVKELTYTVVAPAPPSDTTPPTITVTSPTDAPLLLGSSVNAQFTCADNVAIASCVSTVANGAALDTATVGSKSYTITATDTAGLQVVRLVTYEVHWPFGGFTGPVEGPPVLNTGKAGGVVPVKFSLDGDRGLAILKAGFPKSAKISCSGLGTPDALEVYVSASSPGNNTLSYDSVSGQYGYNWKTDKSWSNTCRQLIFELTDGSTATANFQFK